MIPWLLGIFFPGSIEKIPLVSIMPVTDVALETRKN